MNRCGTCGKRMFRGSRGKDQPTLVWVRQHNQALCTNCYQKQLRQPKSVSPLALLAGIAGVAIEAPSRSRGLPNCLSCGVHMRDKGSEPASGVRARHTTELCTTCYQRRRRNAKDRADQGHG